MKNYSFENHPQMAYKLQQLSREEMKLKLLQDIKLDIEICKFEDWNHKQYLNELKEMIDSLAN